MEKKHCNEANCEKCALNDLYENTFKGGEYKDQFYKTCDVEFRFWMTNIYKIFSKEFHRKQSCQLLDFACGPVPIYSATTVAADFPAHITFSDVVEDNRNEIETWMKGDKEKSIDWDAQFEFIEKISGRSISDIKKDLRADFVETVHGDVHKEMPIPGKENFFDIILTNLSLEYACVDMDKYKKAVKHLGNMMKPGGYLAQGGALNVANYFVDGKEFPACALTFEKIKAVFDDPETGMQLIFYNTNEYTGKRDGVEGMTGQFYIVAQKMGTHVHKKELVAQIWKE